MVDTKSPQADANPRDARTDLSASGLIGRVLAGDFEIRRELGRGGMGTVYEAWQRSLQRVVALKVLAGSLGLTGSAVVRFQREAQAAAKLHHSNIVAIYAQGEEGGVYFYVMEYIEGRSLADMIDEMRGGHRSSALNLTETRLVLGSGSGSPSPGTVDPDQTVSLNRPPPALPDPPSRHESVTASASTIEHFDYIATQITSVADALDYAHRQGVIHRDVKPHNCLFGNDGRVYVTDFGLARVLEQPGVTMTGEFIGSPLYMSPEQITGGSDPVDHRTDIYSLGATMYEWMTLSAPYPGTTREQVISKIINAEPALPRWLNPRIPVDMETVCLKAIEREPGHRYATAGEMADDLRRYLKRSSIRARREGPVARLRKFIRRNQAASWAGVVMIVAASVAVGVSFFQERTFERRRAEQKEQIAAIQDNVQQLEDERNALAAEKAELLEAIEVSRSTPLERLWGFGSQALGQVLQAPTTPDAQSPPPPKPPEVSLADAPPTFNDDDRTLIGDLVGDFVAVLQENAPPQPGDVETALPFAAQAERDFQAALRTESPPESLALVNQVLRNNPTHFDAVYLRAIMNARLGRFEQVIQDADKFLLLLRPEAPAGYIMRGVGRLCTGDFQMAWADFDRALELQPNEPRITYLRGLAEMFSVGFDTALADLDRAVDLDPNNAGAYVARGAFHAKRESFVQAIYDFEQAQRRDPEHVAANRERKHIWDQVAAKVLDYSKQLQADPGNAVLLEKRGDAYAILGDYQLADADYAKAAEAVHAATRELPPRLLSKRTFCVWEIGKQASAARQAKPDVDPANVRSTEPDSASLPDWLRGLIP